MRLSDGEVRSFEHGVAIELECGFFASWTWVSWAYIFTFNRDQKVINKHFTKAIEAAQRKFDKYLEAADAQKEQKNNEK